MHVRAAASSVGGSNRSEHKNPIHPCNKARTVTRLRMHTMRSGGNSPVMAAFHIKHRFLGFGIDLCLCTPAVFREMGLKGAFRAIDKRTWVVASPFYCRNALIVRRSFCETNNLQRRHVSHDTPTKQSRSLTLSQAALSSRRLTQHRVAARAHNHSLSVRKDGRDVVAIGALDVHEERVGALNQTLLLVHAGLSLLVRVQQVIVLREKTSDRNRSTHNSLRKKKTAAPFAFTIT